MSKIQENRNAMKCPDFSKGMKKTDQQMMVPHPPHGKPPAGDLITLPDFNSANQDDKTVINDSYSNLLDTRRSVRAYNADIPMTGKQLAFMLYTAFGVQGLRGKDGEGSIRPAPSGGARHAFELYAAVQNVEGLKPGLYRYVPMANVGSKAVVVESLGPIESHKETINNALAKQKWATDAAIVLFVTCLPYKAEWRYGEMAHRVVLIDLGHLGQNVVLSAVALGLGSCCMAAFDQKACDVTLKVDGNDEFTVYAIAVGASKE
jgi:SagB-type dehydrogenase family enzyme